MNALLQTFGNLGPMRVLALAGTAAAVVGFFLFLIARLTTPPMTLLYADLEVGDASQIVAKLDAMSVPYELRGDGTQIFVPTHQVLRLRMSMATEGLPAGGSIGYEIFDRSQALGATRSMQNINVRRALEGELARTIRSLSQVASARVHLVLPKRELFSRDRQEPSASVVVKTKGGSPLKEGQVRAIQHLVAAAVPGLNTARISIIDDKGRLLAASGEGDDDLAAVVSAAEEYRSRYEARLRRMIVDLLERSVGFGKVRAQVHAEVDFDRITINSETFDPDGQVVRSTQSIEEVTVATDTRGVDNVSVANTLPDAQGELAPAGNRSNTSRTDETANYEISKTITSHVRNTGTVKRLSIAVLVDGTYTLEADGTRAYRPRSQEEMDKLAALVRSAAGFDEERGDTLEIVNMAFAQLEEPEAAAEAPVLGLVKGDYFKIAEMAALLVVAVLVVLLVLRPVVAHAFTARASRTGTADANEAVGQRAIPAPEGAPPRLTAEAGDQGVPRPRAEDEQTMIDLERIEGRVKGSSIRKIGEIVDKHPDAAVGIIRTWLQEEI